MAIARFSVKVGLKNDGEKVSAVSHSSYIMATGKYDKKEDEIVYKNSHLPTWAKDEKHFWELAEVHERANANIYKEHVISLPREFTTEQNIAFIDEWIKEEFKGQHYYNYAIHNPKAKDGLDQPHCHLMFCERINDGIERSAEQYFKRYNSKNPEKGGAKKANTGLTKTQMKNNLIEQRKRFGEVLQKHLDLANVNYKVDMRNWEERGLTEPPQNKSFNELKYDERLDKEIVHNPIWQSIRKHEIEEMEKTKKYKDTAIEMLRNQNYLLTGKMPSRSVLDWDDKQKLNIDSFNILKKIEDKADFTNWLRTTEDKDTREAFNKLVDTCVKQNEWRHNPFTLMNSFHYDADGNQRIYDKCQALLLGDTWREDLKPEHVKAAQAQASATQAPKPTFRP